MATKLVVTPDGKSFVTGGRSLQVWDVATGVRRDALTTYESNTSSALAVTGDGRYLIAGAPWNTLEIWDLERRQQIHTLKHDDDVNDVALLPGTPYMASACGMFMPFDFVQWEKDTITTRLDVKSW